MPLLLEDNLLILSLNPERAKELSGLPPWPPGPLLLGP